jgi:nitrate/nitrite transporter NarK
VDRAGFKTTSVLADLASGTAVALVPLLHTTTMGLAFWQLLVLVFLRSFLTTPGRGARRALIPDLAGTARMPLTRANAVDETIQPLPFLIGPPLAVAAGAFALAGTLGGPLNPLLITVTQKNTPQAMRGRVFGLLRALVVCGTAFGILVGGFLVEGVGLRPTVIAMGLCYLGLTLSMFLNPSLRQM